MEQERTQPRSVHDLAAEKGLNLWGLARRYQDWVPWVDAAYGSATYLPMADDADYRITLSATGLLARPSNEPARRSVRGWD